MVDLILNPNSEEKVAFRAADAIGTLAGHLPNNVEIREAGAIEPLVTLIRGSRSGDIISHQYVCSICEILRLYDM